MTAEEIFLGVALRIGSGANSDLAAATERDRGRESTLGPVEIDGGGAGDPQRLDGDLWGSAATAVAMGARDWRPRQWALRISYRRRGGGIVLGICGSGAGRWGSQAAALGGERERGEIR
ncbi:hypothetical protein E2562_019930, partial [Oryza meyeriana var. granulata]